MHQIVASREKNVENARKISLDPERKYGGQCADRRTRHAQFRGHVTLNSCTANNAVKTGINSLRPYMKRKRLDRTSTPNFIKIRQATESLTLKSGPDTRTRFPHQAFFFNFLGNA